VTSRVTFRPEFGDAVRLRGLTLTELAHRAGVCVATASSAVRERQVNLSTALRLAKVVDATPVIRELELWIRAQGADSGGCAGSEATAEPDV
jgi:plasmid maintenance system antidote protein VapI